MAGIVLSTGQVCGFSISVSGDSGGFSEEIGAGIDDYVNSYAAVWPGGLSNYIEGSGSLRESHRVANTAGSNAAVGVDIRDADSYVYSYYLSPGAGSFWPAKNYPEVSASETLDVFNASFIRAYASAGNGRGMSAGVSTVLIDPGKKASLFGYFNDARASSDSIIAYQMADAATAPGGSIGIASSASGYFPDSMPGKLQQEKASSSTTVQHGSVGRFSDHAVSSTWTPLIEENIESASSESISVMSRFDLLSKSSYGAMNITSAKVSAEIGGNLTNYLAVAESPGSDLFAVQAGHIVGSFSGTAQMGAARNSRSSNYGEEYDFLFAAYQFDPNPSALGIVGYYVDDDNPLAGSIQSAVDASQAEDTINVAPGIYRENVQIDKSLTVAGRSELQAGASGSLSALDISWPGVSLPVVDGGKNGSTFTIGRYDPDINVALQGLVIQNGSGTYTERWPGEPPVQCGGGIWNAGTLYLADSTVTGNSANEYGSGIWNSGRLNVESSLIANNGKPRDGGGIWNSGYLALWGSTVMFNSAWWNGGGIWNSGTMQAFQSNISANSAGFYGGGIANDMGQAYVMDTLMTADEALLGGGAVYNIFGQVDLDGNDILGNAGHGAGGAVLNNGGMIVSGGQISGNNAERGGAIFNMGTLNMNNVRISDSDASSDGGGVYNTATLYLDNSEISGNHAYRGGGIFNSGTVNLNGGSIDHNSASLGGGIFNDYYGQVNLIAGSIENNTASSPSPSGGGIYNLNTVTGNASLVHDNTPDQIEPIGVTDWMPSI